MMRSRPVRTARRILIHLLRVTLFAAILLLIHLQQRQRDVSAARAAQALPLQRVQQLFPQAAELRLAARSAGGWDVLDADGRRLGYALQTSPVSDSILGFSGPTNLLVTFDLNNRIHAVDILSSGDTREHVGQIRKDPRFLPSFQGLSWNQAATRPDVDAVTGATLTCLAIQESLMRRLGGGQPSLRFPHPLSIEQVAPLFPGAATVQQNPRTPSTWQVFAADGAELGTILRTSPAADQIIGYQGPTETLIGFDVQGRATGIALGKSYDNEPYVTYVRDDATFPSLFNTLFLEQLAQFDLEEQEVEGVSGATMTSLAVAQGVIKAAQQRLAEQQVAPPRRRWLTPEDLGTLIVIVAGFVLGFSRLRGNRVVRVGFLLVLVGYLGLVTGNLLSQAMLVGWAQHGIPWRAAPGLVLLSLAAFATPLTTRRNLYCSHLCPHGAAQQLLQGRAGRVRPPRRIARLLKAVPPLLLAWSLLVAMLGLPFSLVDIEPFDAWLFRVAGAATLGIALVGLAASLWVPMAYCRYGCPTGTLLGYLRYHSRSDHLTHRDSLALALLLLAAGLMLYQA